MVTSHFAPTSTRLTNSPQVGRRPISLPTLRYRNLCSGWLLLIQSSQWSSEAEPCRWWGLVR